MTPPTQHDVLKLAEAVREAAAKKMKQMADSAYCNYADLHKQPECLGEDYKIKNGLFGAENINAHRRSAQKLGAHTALMAAVDALRLMDVSAIVAAHIHPTPQDAQDVQRSATVGPCEDEQLKKDAARGKFFTSHAEWIRHEDRVTGERYAMMAIRLPYEVNLSCKPLREDALDAKMGLRPDSHGTRVEAAPAVIADKGLSEGLAGEPVAWQRITKPGQVKVGDKLHFTIGDDHFNETFSETAKQILHPGTDREEIIYNKRRNYYLITSMAIENKGSQKNVEFMRVKGETA